MTPTPRHAARAAAATGALLLGTLAWRAYATRPLRDGEDAEPFRSTGAFITREQEADPLQRLTRAAVLTAVTLAVRAHLDVLNSFRVREDERYAELLRLVNAGRAGRGGRGLLTVSNHVSVLDDPMLQASLVGFRPALHPVRRFPPLARTTPH